MPDSYGSTDVFDDLRDAVKTSLDSLMAELSATTATISYTYNTHHKAKIQLNALSCEIVDAPVVISGINTGVVCDYDISVSIRAHTGYLGKEVNSPVDTQEIGRLMDSVNTWFHVHLALASGYKIKEINELTMYEEFDESKTFGGSLVLLIYANISHVQV